MDGSLLAPLMNSSSESLPAGRDTAQPGGHHPVPGAHAEPETPRHRRPPPAQDEHPWAPLPGLQERAKPLRLPGLPPATPADASHLISMHAAPSKTPGFSHETFPLIPSISSHLPSLLVSICRKIFSVLFSGVDSSSGMFITEETIL